MANKSLLKIEVLHKRLVCNADVGKLFWRERTLDMSVDQRSCSIWNAQFSGVEAFTAYSKGYKRGNINGFFVYAHRVIWAMHTGAWPIDQIDHINHNRDDNRIINLREVSVVENSQNSKLYNTNSSGVTGVSFCKRLNKWRAYIMIDYKQISLGYFIDKSQAIIARKQAELSNGFHRNHGASQ